MGLAHRRGFPPQAHAVFLAVSPNSETLCSPRRVCRDPASLAAGLCVKGLTQPDTVDCPRRAVRAGPVVVQEEASAKAAWQTLALTLPIASLRLPHPHPRMACGPWGGNWTPCLISFPPRPLK